jgi:lysyl-tRNA synthetase class 1
MQKTTFLPRLNFEKPLRGKAKPAGTLVIGQGEVTVVGYNKLPPDVKKSLRQVLHSTGLDIPEDVESAIKDLVVPRFYRQNVSTSSWGNRAPLLGRCLPSGGEQTNALCGNRDGLTEGGLFSGRAFLAAKEGGPKRRLYGYLNFDEIKIRADGFADKLERERSEIAQILTGYECYNVVMDEVDRSVDHLRNLDKNREYFVCRVGGVSTYLPSNQPLYASVCFGIVPSFMATDVAMRPPAAMQPTLERLSQALDLTDWFPNLKICSVEQSAFTRMRHDFTDAVIFTGKPENGAKVRSAYRPETLFILNGAGHNPLVVTNTADVELAVRSAIRTVLQNQGQDCAAPNSILVHCQVLSWFMHSLLHELQGLKDRVGSYRDPKSIVGPNSRPDDIPRIIKLIRDNAQWRVYGGEIDAADNLIKPTVFVRPLLEGPWYTEFFAPFFMVQPYETDAELTRYFESPEYRPNAMYVCVFGDSPYVEGLVDRGLHTHDNILHNKDVHETERGWRPYGGIGPDASSLFIDGRSIPGATLPQRDIYLYLVVPQLGSGVSTPESHAEPSLSDRLSCRATARKPQLQMS